MKKQLLISFRILLVMTILLGVIYPLMVTGISQLLFPEQANGSLVYKDGHVVGSALIAQPTQSEAYFHGRPSAADYKTTPSGASNLGLTSQKLHTTVSERKKELIANFGLENEQALPADMLFASASGLDPHISPEAAYLQVNKITAVRGFSVKQKEELRSLITNMTEQPQFGILGCARVNVLLLNLELDKLQ